MATITVNKPGAEPGLRSKDELEHALIFSEFPALLLKNASSELDLNGKAVKDFIAKAQEYAGSSTGLDRLKLLTEFVYKQIPYDIKKQGNPLFEDMLAGKSGGVCLHKASALHLVLVYEEFNVKAEGGPVTFKGILLGTHAWLSVDIDGVKYLSDPTNRLIGKYSEFDIKSVATGLLQQQTIERYGLFNMLRKETVEIKEVGQTFWDWQSLDGFKYNYLPPEAIANAVATVVPSYTAFTKTLENLNASFAEHNGKIVSGIELELASAYSVWAGASLKEVKKLDELVKTLNQDSNNMHIS